MKKLIAYAILALPLTATCTGADEDVLTGIRKSLADADCCRFVFNSIVHSDIFDSVDSALGVAYIAADGRYRVSIGDDVYFYDGTLLRSYSNSHNQLTIEKPAPHEAYSAEVSFITRLDQYYSIEPTRQNREYRLKLLSPDDSELPDSMTVRVRRNPDRLDRIEYYDINEVLKLIEFLRQQTLVQCEADSLSASFPDSVDVIKLY
jgi:outer membrane lipoprotein-sorting protein